MTDSSIYSVWLSLALGYCSPKPKAVLSQYDSFEEFYNSSEADRRLSGLFNNNELSALESTPLSKAQAIADQCGRLGIEIIPLDSEGYPERLSELQDPPAALYVKGILPDFASRLAIAMVGTRKATAYGKKTSHVLAGSLAKVGVIVVSGGAVGIDSFSHIGAMEAGGVTVCVLGCGINFPYLSANRKMREDISKRGAVVSEYPPDYPPGKYTFPDRNRIISGLSNGVVVVEAGLKSGSLITARLASEQGRDVFAVMGNITSPYSQGTNALIKDGAVPVTDFTDVTGFYPQFNMTSDADDIDKLVDNIPRHRTDIDVSDNARAVYKRITADPVHIDIIASSVGLPVSIVLRALTELELEGLIKAEKGRMYRLI